MQGWQVLGFLSGKWRCPTSWGCREDAAGMDVQCPARPGLWLAFSECHDRHALSGQQSPLWSVSCAKLLASP